MVEALEGVLLDAEVELRFRLRFGSGLPGEAMHACHVGLLIQRKLLSDHSSDRRPQPFLGVGIDLGTMTDVGTRVVVGDVEVVATAAAGHRRVGVLAAHRLVDEDEAAVDGRALRLVDRCGIAVGQVLGGVVERDGEPPLFVGDDVERPLAGVDTDDRAAGAVEDANLVVVAEGEQWSPSV